MTDVLLISIDSLRVDHISAYGYRRQTTPGLEVLLRNTPTTRFNKAYSTSAWTLPSHASLFTGLYPAKHGVFDRYGEIDPTETLPAILRRHGYRTSSFSNNGWLIAANLSDAFQHRQEYFQIEESKPRHRQLVEQLSMYLGMSDSGADRTINDFLEWFDQDERPSFGLLQFMEPHYPYAPPKQYRGMFGGGSISTVRQIQTQNRIFQNRPEYFSGSKTLTTESITAFKDLYDSAIAYLDRKLQELFNALRKRDRFEDTLIVLLGDHGEHFGERLLVGHHFSLSDALLHVPLIVKWPGSDWASLHETASNTPIDFTDLFEAIKCVVECPQTPQRVLPKSPSELQFASYRVPAHIEERFPEQKGGKQVLDRFPKEFAAVRSEEFKLTRRGETECLVDTTNLVSTRTDVSGQYPDVTKRLRSSLDNHLSKSQSSESGDGDLQEGIKQHLKKLGYL